MDQRDAGNAAERGAMDPARSDPSDSAFNIRGGGGASAAQRAQEMATVAPPGHTDESESAVLDKGLHRSLPELTDDELRRLSVLEPGTQLDQGGVYLDLNHLEAGPITAFGAGGEGHIRCSYATALPKLEDALARMEGFVRSLPGFVPAAATGVAG